MKRNIVAAMLLPALLVCAPAQDKDNSDKLRIDDDQNYPVLSTNRIQRMEKETAANQ